MSDFDWSCPFCNHAQIVTDKNFHYNFERLDNGNSKLGDVGLSVFSIRCTNKGCNEITLQISLVGAAQDGRFWSGTETVHRHWRLRPDSAAKHQPDYIPAPLREDYIEACSIRDLSPKASATLARRCLQGMIRDFCGISRARLVDEIRDLKKQLDDGHAPRGVQIETIEAIDAIRKVGNIGAHMERDIDLIVDVDPGEAQALIELLEMLFEEWYVARHKREERLARVKEVADQKALELAEAKAAKSAASNSSGP